MNHDPRPGTGAGHPTIIAGWPPGTTTRDMSDDTHNAVATFIERMGLSAQADGLPRIAGRMWGYFIIHGGPSSFAELAENLQVSRGSISTNARLLRDLGMIERVAHPGDRQDYYRLAEEPYDRMMEGYAARMRHIVDNVEHVQEALPDDWTDAQQRLTEMRRFYHTAIVTTEDLIEALRAKRPSDH